MLVLPVHYPSDVPSWNLHFNSFTLCKLILSIDNFQFLLERVLPPCDLDKEIRLRSRQSRSPYKHLLFFISINSLLLLLCLHLLKWLIVDRKLRLLSLPLHVRERNVIAGWLLRCLDESSRFGPYMRIDRILHHVIEFFLFVHHLLHCVLFLQKPIIWKYQVIMWRGNCIRYLSELLFIWILADLLNNLGMLLDSLSLFSGNCCLDTLDLTDLLLPIIFLFISLGLSLCDLTDFLGLGGSNLPHGLFLYCFPKHLL